MTADLDNRNVSAKGAMVTPGQKSGRINQNGVPHRSGSHMTGEKPGSKMGKRRATSNNADKKVSLDKFLSVVQQRVNYTP